MAYDEIRYLRIAIKMDEEHLANAPLGPKQKARLEKVIAFQKKRLKKLNKKKRKKKKIKEGGERWLVLGLKKRPEK